MNREASPIGMLSTGPVPSMDAWMQEAKKAPDSARIGMYLVHNGVVREDARTRVREGDSTAKAVTGMRFHSDSAKVQSAIDAALQMPGIFYVRVWLNEGQLRVGDDIMYVLIGGDIRPRVLDALQFLVGKIKTECVTEKELY